MIGFEILINGHHLCLAGVGDDGVLNTIVNFAGCREDYPAETFMHIGGIESGTDEHVRWKVPAIGIGAEILVRIVETATVDPPVERYRCDPPSTVEQCHECLQSFTHRMTSDERRHLLRELIQELENTESQGNQT